MRRTAFAAILALLLGACSSSGGGTVITVLGYTVTIKTAPPTTAQVGTSIPVAFTVTENESDGTSKPASGKSFTVTVTAGGGTVNGATSAALTTGADGSVALTWILGPTVGTQTVRGAAADKFLDVSVTATAPPPTQLGFTTAPATTAQSGIALTQQPSVQIRDATGTPVAQAQVPVTVAIGVGGGTLAGGPLTVNTDATGVATFAGLMITGLAGPRTLTFTTTLAGTPVTLSAPVALTAGLATQLVLITPPPTTAQSGVVLTAQPTVQLQDAQGNPVAQALIPVTVAIDVGGGTLGGTLTVNTNASGAAVFSGLAISGIIGNRTLKFTATLGGSPASIGSASIALAAGPAAQLTVTTQPATTPVVGFPLSRQPVVQLRDAAGNAVSQAGVVVTASVATGMTTLASVPMATTDATGVATFTTVKLIGNVGAATLGFGATLGNPVTVASATMNIMLPGNGKIVFKSGSDALWVVNPNGTGLQQLTPGVGMSTCTAGDEEPKWSPDGSKIVFTRTQNGAQEIWTMNADGSNQTQLTNSGSPGCLDGETTPAATWNENPSWSPDGTRIIFTSDRSPTSVDEDLWIMNADGSNQVKFFGSTASHESEAMFSPDGKTIVFQVEPINPTGCGGFVNGGEIWLINADATNPRRLTTITNCGFEENYTWSPDGKKIYFTFTSNALSCMDDIVSVTSDPNIVDRFDYTLCFGGGGSEHPMVSPDGTRVVFANGSGGETIWTMLADGSQKTMVNLGGMGRNGEPAWQPILPPGAGLRQPPRSP